MQAGKLMISRGMPGAAEAIPIRREPVREAPPPAAPRAASAEAAIPAVRELPAPDFHLLHYRLAALERLSALRDKGALTFEEFAAEKALVLRLPAEELLLGAESILPPRGPSLLGRLFGWKLLLLGGLAGLGFVAVTAPQELTNLVDRFSALLS